MKQQNFQHATNTHVASKINEIIKDAELAYQLANKPHRDSFITAKNKAHGLTRRILERLIQVDSSKFTDEFMNELLREVWL